jgi:hypothetical protein
MQAITIRCQNMAIPFTRVGSQVQSLPRPPLNPYISEAFSGFGDWIAFLENAERHANKRRFAKSARTKPVHFPHPSMFEVAA